MIESTQVFQKRADARYRNVGGEGVVVRQSAGDVLVVNDVGLRVLDLLVAGNPVAGVVTALIAEYEVDRATLEPDVIGYVQELLDAGIIERATAGNAN